MALGNAMVKLIYRLVSALKFGERHTPPSRRQSGKVIHQDHIFTVRIGAKSEYESEKTWSNAGNDEKVRLSDTFHSLCVCPECFADACKVYADQVDDWLELGNGIVPPKNAWNSLMQIASSGANGWLPKPCCFDYEEDCKDVG